MFRIIKGPYIFFDVVLTWSGNNFFSPSFKLGVLPWILFKRRFTPLFVTLIDDFQKRLRESVYSSNFSFDILTFQTKEYTSLQVGPYPYRRGRDWSLRRYLSFRKGYGDFRTMSNVWRWEIYFRFRSKETLYNSD